MRCAPLKIAAQALAGPRDQEQILKFVIAIHGTRGDIEPALAVALALQQRGHEIAMAAPPNLVAFAESVLQSPVTPYGPDSQKQLETDLFRHWWRLRNPVTVFRQAQQYVMAGWADMSRVLAHLANDADIIVCGTTYQEVASNVAQAKGVPIAALHYFPVRVNPHILPFRLPMSLLKPVWAMLEWAHWRLIKPADDEQRQALGLPRSQMRSVRRMVEAGTLEIQAYDPVFFSGLQAQWGKSRPLVGSLTLGLETTVDTDVMAWIAQGSLPVYFGFGSMPVENPIDTFSMIIRACQEVGVRALICMDIDEVMQIAPSHEAMFVRRLNHSSIFKHCKAIVHHGGAGTTAASVRAGVPTLVLWVGADQPVWAQQIKRLGVGTARRLTSTTLESLQQDLKITLSNQSAQRARQVAQQMIALSESLSTTVNLLEAHAENSVVRAVRPH